MEGIRTIQDLLASGADVAIVAFAYFLWKIDRRLLVVENQIKSLWTTVRTAPKSDSNG